MVVLESFKKVLTFYYINDKILSQNKNILLVTCIFRYVCVIILKGCLRIARWLSHQRWSDKRCRSTDLPNDRQKEDVETHPLNFNYMELIFSRLFFY